MIRIEWDPRAKRELFRGSDFYEEEVSGLGEIFLGRIEQTLRLIAEHPQSGPRVLRNLRKHRVNRFPYNLIYRIDPDRIFILAVAHHKRRPYYWAWRA